MRRGKDPGELTNLAGDRQRAAVLNGLRARLKAWEEKTEDPWVVKYKILVTSATSPLAVAQTECENR